MTAVVQSAQDSLQIRQIGRIAGGLSSGETIRMLGFGIGTDRYGIDLGEAVCVIKDLLRIQVCTREPFTRQVVKRNRKHVVVFNLDRCISVCRGETAGKGRASFLMLDEKIDDEHVGILVPGIPSIQKQLCSRKNSTRTRRDHARMPLAGTAGPRKRDSKKNQKQQVGIIDLRELVDDCIIHLKYSDALHGGMN